MPSGQSHVVHSLTHTKWNCKYHIVFAPKYRGKVFYEEKRLAIRDIQRQLCEWKGVEILEGEICPDHVHLLVSIPPKISVSSFVDFPAVWKYEICLPKSRILVQGILR